MLFFGSKQARKDGTQNGKQRYRCVSCHKRFSGGQKLSPNTLWQRYSEGRQNVTEISGVRLQALAGHDVIKIWIIREGNERGPTVGFYNVTLNKFFWVDGRWKEFHRHTVWIALLQMGCLFIAFGVAFYFGRMFESWLVFWALFIGVLFGIINFAGNLEDANQQRVLGWKRQIAALLDKYYFQKKAA